MQEKKTNEWAPLLQIVVKAHSNLSHEALMAGADPNHAYVESNTALQFELRENAGTKITKYLEGNLVENTCEDVVANPRSTGK